MWRIALVCVLLVGLRLNAAIFSFAHLSDSHIASNSTSSTNDQTAFFEWMLESATNTDLNMVGLLTTGDMWQPYTNAGVVDNPVYITNEVDHWVHGLSNLVAQGFLVVTSDGNHEMDPDKASATRIMNSARVVDANYLAMMETNHGRQLITGQSGFITNRAGNSRNAAFAYTNTGIRLLFLTFEQEQPDGNTYYVGSDSNVVNSIATQTDWASNLLAEYPDHNAVLLGHYWISRWAALSTMDGTASSNYFGGTSYYSGYTFCNPSLYAWTNGLSSATNLLCMLGGHDRGMKKRHAWVRGAGGQLVDVCGFVMHNYSTNKMGLVNVLTFRPERKDVLFRTYSLDEARWLEEGESPWSEATLPNTATVVHEWATPLAVPRNKRAFMK